MALFQMVKEKLEEGVTLLRVTGSLDAHAFAEFEKAITELFDQNTYRVIVDLSKLDYISSAGAGAVLLQTEPDNPASA